MVNTSVIIVGAGPSGITAAIYLKRANIPFILIEKSIPGGKIALTSIIENYPGYDSIEGVDLALNIKKQLKHNNIETTFDNINEITKDNDIFIVKGDFETYKARYVIIATGTKEKKLNIDKEDKFYGKGLSFCAVCDGSLYKNKDVAVIGGGNSSLEEATYLSSICNKVYLIHRRNEFRGDDILVQKIKKINNIHTLTPYIPISLIGDTTIEGLIIKNNENNVQKEIKVSGVFIYIGNIANSDFIKLDIEQENGYIITNEDMLSSIKGLYATGDIRKKKIRQIVTAVNDGAIAALTIEKEINNK